MWTVLRFFWLLLSYPKVDFERRSFMERARAKEFRLRDLDRVIDDAIEAWHKGDSNLTLPEFLGMTEEEYTIWVEGGSIYSLLSRK